MKSLKSRRPLPIWLLTAGVITVLVSPHFVHAQSTVSIKTDDGGVIKADVYGAGERGLILAHGGRFDRTSWLQQARVLSDAGFRVIAFDFRAAVEGRDGNETGCLYDPVCLSKDVLAVMHYLHENGVKTISIVGA